MATPIFSASRLRSPTPAASLLAAILPLLAACGADATEPPPTERPTDAAPPPTTTLPATDPTPSPEQGPTVAVAHERELRGAWISSVWNGTWPSKSGLTKEAAQAELIVIFDALAAANMNAVFLQVRPESDALYESALEPWSRFLTGEQGKSPGFDPLAFAVAEGHKRGLEIHAWLNPYRGLASGSSPTHATHPTKTLANAVITYGNQKWMDPGSPAVRAHILDVIDDLLARYDIDGLHFDDYFYPYPADGATFDDDATFEAYTTGGGTLNRADWRRANVDALIAETSAHVAQKRPDVRFGISPFGIYRPGTPAGITGLDAYATLYCDPLKWMDEGWVDYLAPQLYWPTTKTAQAYGILVAWWASIAKGGRSIFVGHDATKVGTTGWPLTEYDAQIVLARAQRGLGVLGSIFFSAKPIVDDTLGLRTALTNDHYLRAAATPPLAVSPGAAPLPPPPAPTLTVTGRTVTLASTVPARSVGLYEETPNGLILRRIVPPADGSSGSSAVLTVEPGRWAISVIDRRSVESPGRAIRVE